MKDGLQKQGEGNFLLDEQEFPISGRIQGNHIQLDSIQSKNALDLLGAGINSSYG